MTPFARFLLLASFLLAPSISVAEEGPTRSVRVVVAGDRETREALEAPIESLLDERLVELDWRVQKQIQSKDVLQKREEEPQLLATIWLDVRNPERALLYIADTTSDRFLVRVVPLQNGYDEISRESLANIVESAINALLEGIEIGVTRDEAAPQVERESGPPETRKQSVQASTTPPPPEKPVEKNGGEKSFAEHAPVLDALLLGVRLDTLKNTEALRFGPELSFLFVLGKRTSPSWFIEIDASYRLPSTWSSDVAGLELSGTGVRVLVGIEGPRQRATFRAGLGVALQLDRVDAISGSPEYDASPTFWVTSPLISGMGGMDFRISGPWFLFLSLGADLDLAGHRYEITSDGSVDTALSPWRVRPTGSVALGFDFLP